MCMQALLQQAGTHSGGSQVDPLCWENFRTWFSRGLKTLHQVRIISYLSLPTILDILWSCNEIRRMQMCLTVLLHLYSVMVGICPPYVGTS